jgi:hypothetical protein
METYNIIVVTYRKKFLFINYKKRLVLDNKNDYRMYKKYGNFYLTNWIKNRVGKIVDFTYEEEKIKPLI